MIKISPSSPISLSSASQSTSTADSEVISVEARNELYSKLLSDLLLELDKDPNKYPDALQDICKLENPQPHMRAQALRAKLAVLCDHCESFLPFVRSKLNVNAQRLPRDVKNELMHRVGKGAHQCNQPPPIDIVYARPVEWI